MFIEKKKVAGAIITLLLASAGLAQKALAVICTCSTDQGPLVIKFGSASPVTANCDGADGTSKEGKKTGEKSSITVKIKKCSPAAAGAGVDFTTQD